MADKLSLHIITRGQVRSAAWIQGYDDPDGIGVLDVNKREALLGNPLAGGEDEPTQIIGLSGNRVIGRMDLIAGSLVIEGAPARIFWSSHLIVPPEFRRTLMGIMLIMKAAGLGAIAGAFGPSQAALPVYQKLKWVDLAIARHIMVVRSGPVVRRYVGGGMGGAAVARIADAVLGGHRCLTSLWRALRTRGLRVERLARAPGDFDARFAGRAEMIQAHRSAGFLQWQLDHRFVEEPRNANALYLVRNRKDEVVGYFLNKIRFHESATHRGFKNLLLGSMQDWMSFDAAALDVRDLLLLSIRELVAGGVDAVDFCTADPSLRATLGLLGFRRLGALHLMLKSPVGGPPASARWEDLRHWWIRPGDGDNFFT